MSISASEEQGDTWYAYFSEKHQREYYYEPHTETTTWVSPIGRILPYDERQNSEEWAALAKRLETNRIDEEDEDEEIYEFEIGDKSQYRVLPFMLWTHRFALLVVLFNLILLFLAYYFLVSRTGFITAFSGSMRFPHVPVVDEKTPSKIETMDTPPVSGRVENLASEDDIVNHIIWDTAKDSLKDREEIEERVQDNAESETKRESEEPISAKVEEADSEQVEAESDIDGYIVELLNKKENEELTNSVIVGETADVMNAENEPVLVADEAPNSDTGKSDEAEPEKNGLWLGTDEAEDKEPAKVEVAQQKVNGSSFESDNSVPEQVGAERIADVLEKKEDEEQTGTQPVADTLVEMEVAEEVLAPAMGSREAGAEEPEQISFQKQDDDSSFDSDNSVSGQVEAESNADAVDKKEGEEQTGAQPVEDTVGEMEMAEEVSASTIGSREAGVEEPEEMTLQKQDDDSSLDSDNSVSEHVEAESNKDVLDKKEGQEQTGAQPVADTLVQEVEGTEEVSTSTMGSREARLQETEEITLQKQDADSSFELGDKSNEDNVKASQQLTTEPELTETGHTDEASPQLNDDRKEADIEGEQAVQPEIVDDKPKLADAKVQERLVDMTKATGDAREKEAEAPLSQPAKDSEKKFRKCRVPFAHLVDRQCREELAALNAEKFVSTLV